ncbi:MAG TPA: phosphomannose isomerase type II C-terminal cupin domain [Polaromonas sp.]|uniref:phosphomannose isomerase type II C-terminal cupin domain n=1 Tax=Polaromonas sp. TaxID=1869339 RepID=UPI002D4E9B5B|nr:phosphomannose isomerase type II C-terminal cupin domain [Polaromonas sp.]HYW56155.1 phosphomannose isomerase type II C-terminal cupin domain [Polaromonas sp.]
MTKTTERTETIERTERPWGWYETVSEVAGNKIKRIGVNPGQQLSLQKHHQRSEHWVVVQGTARITLDDREFDLQPGQACDIAIGQVHRLANLTQDTVEIVEVQFGSYLGEDDIVRLQDNYGRA